MCLSVSNNKNESVEHYRDKEIIQIVDSLT